MSKLLEFRDLPAGLGIVVSVPDHPDHLPDHLRITSRITPDHPDHRITRITRITSRITPDHPHLRKKTN